MVFRRFIKFGLERTLSMRVFLKQYQASSRLLQVLIVLFLGLNATAWSQTPEETFHDWKQALSAQPGLQGLQVCCRVEDDRGQLLFESEGQRLVLPASTLKVATAVAVLEKASPEAELLTRLQVQGPRLRWQGGYDPELTASQLEELALQASARLPQKVTLEVPPPDPQPYPSGWSWDDLSTVFAPPVSSLIFDRGLIPTRVFLSPEGQLQVAGPPWSPENALAFLPGSEAEFALKVIPGWSGWVMLGQPPLGAEEVVPLPMLRPEQVAVRLLGEVLRRRGHQVEIGVTLPEFRPDWEVSHRSRPLKQILSRALAESDNLAMECLSRAYGRPTPACWKDLPACRVVDGSGLSRYNLVSARHLLAALNSRPEVIELLPLAGQEGTLKKRFLGTPLAQQLRAKTGTLSGVSGLLGEARSARGRKFRFAVLTQGFVAPGRELKLAEDQLLNRLAENL